MSSGCSATGYSRARYAAETTGPILEKLEAYFGMGFPFAKLDQLVIPQTVTFSAMENAGLVTWGESVLLAKPEDESIKWRRIQASINAHELAHQWFGDLLTCTDWAHVWLNEGFASYAEALWAEHDLGRDDFEYELWDQRRQALEGGKKLPIVHRTYAGEWEQFDDRAYPKGSWVVHMLRCRLGEQLFWDALRRYRRRTG